jgi:branched-chain amino acid transport system substrate-binding protein
MDHPRPELRQFKKISLGRLEHWFYECDDAEGCGPLMIIGSYFREGNDQQKGIVMKINRRELVIGGAVSVATLSRRARAQESKEVVIGALFPLSGSMAQTGVDAHHALDTALDIINNSYDLNLPLDKEKGLPNLGGATIRVIYADHQGDPQKGRAEAERLITQEKVSAITGCYHSAVTAVVSETTERYGIPFMCADSSAPSLTRRGLKLFFRASPHDEMFSQAMFDLMDIMRKKGQKIETLALFHEDTIYGTDSANIQNKLAGERGYKVVTDIKYRANSPSLSAEVQQLKTANADVLMPSSYTTDSILLIKTMNALGYKAKAIIAQAAGFAEQSFYDAVGSLAEGVITRTSFSLDIVQKRPTVGKVNDMFKKRAGRDLNDNTSREFTALLILADAINRAASLDSEKIRAALAATDMPGDRTIMPWRYARFDKFGQNNGCDPVLIQYTKGKFVTIFPQQWAVAEPIWPMNT